MLSQKVPAAESLSHGFAVPAPFDKGACGQCPLTISHGSFLRFVTSLTRPVSFYGAILGFFVLSIDSVGTRRSKNHDPKRGQ